MRLRHKSFERNTFHRLTQSTEKSRLTLLLNFLEGRCVRARFDRAIPSGMNCSSLVPRYQPVRSFFVWRYGPAKQYTMILSELSAYLSHRLQRGDTGNLAGSTFTDPQLAEKIASPWTTPRKCSYLVMPLVHITEDACCSALRVFQISTPKASERLSLSNSLTDPFQTFLKKRTHYDHTSLKGLRYLERMEAKYVFTFLWGPIFSIARRPRSRRVDADGMKSLRISVSFFHAVVKATSSSCQTSSCI